MIEVNGEIKDISNIELAAIVWLAALAILLSSEQYVMASCALLLNLLYSYRARRLEQAND